MATSPLIAPQNLPENEGLTSLSEKELNDLKERMKTFNQSFSEWLLDEELDDAYSVFSEKRKQLREARKNLLLTPVPRWFEWARRSNPPTYADAIQLDTKNTSEIQLPEAERAKLKSEVSKHKKRNFVNRGFRWLFNVNNIAWKLEVHAQEEVAAKAENVISAYEGSSEKRLVEHSKSHTSCLLSEIKSYERTVVEYKSDLPKTWVDLSLTTGLNQFIAKLKTGVSGMFDKFSAWISGSNKGPQQIVEDRVRDQKEDDMRPRFISRYAFTSSSPKTTPKKTVKQSVDAPKVVSEAFFYGFLYAQTQSNTLTLTNANKLAMSLMRIQQHWAEQKKDTRQIDILLLFLLDWISKKNQEEALAPQQKQNPDDKMVLKKEEKELVLLKDVSEKEVKKSIYGKAAKAGKEFFTQLIQPEVDRLIRIAELLGLIGFNKWKAPTESDFDASVPLNKFNSVTWGEVRTYITNRLRQHPDNGIQIPEEEKTRHQTFIDNHKEYYQKLHDLFIYGSEKPTDADKLRMQGVNEKNIQLDFNVGDKEYCQLRYNNSYGIYHCGSEEKYKEYLKQETAKAEERAAKAEKERQVEAQARQKAEQARRVIEEKLMKTEEEIRQLQEQTRKIEQARREAEEKLQKAEALIKQLQAAPAQAGQDAAKQQSESTTPNLSASPLTTFAHPKQPSTVPAPAHPSLQPAVGQQRSLSF